MYFGDVTCEQSHATTHMWVKSSWEYHTLNLTVHTLVSAFELEHKHQTDLCATSIVNNETKTMHATQQYKVHNNIMRTI
jgi:hypothetical protein